MHYHESEIEQRSPAETLKDLRSAIEWMENTLNLNVGPTRIAKYEKYLSNKTKPVAFDDYKKYLHTGSELNDFLRVSRVFSKIVDNSLQEKLKHIISGHYHRSNFSKNKSDPSRDYLHELSIAARLICSGLEVDINDVNKCDVVVKALGKILYIECKRVKSKTQLLKRVKEADDQITTRIGIKKLNKVGYITIDITDLLSLDLSILEYKNLEHFKIHSYNLLKEYSNEFRDKIRSTVSKKIYGVIFVAQRLGVIKDDNNKTINMSFLYALGCEKNDKEYDFNSKFLPKFCQKS